MFPLVTGIQNTSHHLAAKCLNHFKSLPEDGSIFTHWGLHVTGIGEQLIPTPHRADPILGYIGPLRPRPLASSRSLPLSQPSRAVTSPS